MNKNEDVWIGLMMAWMLVLATVAFGIALNQISRDNAAHDAWIELCTDGGVPRGTCELSWKHGPEGM